MDAEILGLLTAAGLRDPLKPRGGIPNITAQDVAAALAGLDRTAYWLVRVKYLHDDALRTKLEYAVGRYVAGELMYDYPLANHYIERIACCAVNQAVEPMRCDPCRGTQYIQTATGPRLCRRCGGTGRRRPNKNEMAEMFGVHRNTYRARLERPINGAIQYLDYLEGEAISHIRRKFKQLAA